MPQFFLLLLVAEFCVVCSFLNLKEVAIKDIPWAFRHIFTSRAFVSETLDNCNFVSLNWGEIASLLYVECFELLNTRRDLFLLKRRCISFLQRFAERICMSLVLFVSKEIKIDQKKKKKSLELGCTVVPNSEKQYNICMKD